MDWFGTGDAVENGKKEARSKTSRTAKAKTPPQHAEQSKDEPAYDLADDRIKTVSEISSVISRLLDIDALKDLWVEGEITNHRPHPSGHLYFSLAEIKRGETYVIQAAMWKSYARELGFEPKNGDRVRLYGSVEVYEPHGKYQFIAREIVPCGQGDKHLLVAKWKEQLYREGIFDDDHKKPIPKFPEKVGVVTAAGGAARRDIENIISRRFPVEIILSPAAVQGDNAHTEIAQAIRKIDGMVDVIIVGRGGGSFEDLFEFNHPEVVMAVYNCKTPIISAVGHQIDTTLCDFAADISAPTPSAAAELAVPDIAELLKELAYLRKNLVNSLETRFEREHAELENLRLRLRPNRLAKIINTRQETAAQLALRLRNAITQKLRNERNELNLLKTGLELGNPKLPLKKGYCMVTAGGHIIRTVKDLKIDTEISIELTDGTADAKVTKITEKK
jgi:exodeoxyribonuclease VII large subunit